MADYNVTTDTTSKDAPAFTLAGADTLTLADGVAISTSGYTSPQIGTTAVTSTGLGVHLTLNGDVTSVNGSGIVLGGNDHIDIGASAHITGAETAFLLGRLGDGTGTTTIVNHGTLSSTEFETIYSANEAVNIVNSGTIGASGPGPAAIYSTKGNNTVVNTGSIHGGIEFGEGDDTYDGRGGTITGAVDLGSGNNTAYGGSGAETFFVVGSGNNVIDGGGGENTLTISVDKIVAIDLSQTTAQQTGQGLWTLLNIQDVAISGGSGDLIGNDAANVLTGGSKNDILDGGAGDDHLIGNGGDNILIGGLGDDTLDGGVDIFGFPGSNAARYVGTAAVHVSLLEQGHAQDTGGYGFDTLIHIANLEGGDGDDVLTGDSNSNTLMGGKGDDTLIGSGGNDSLDGGAGNNTAVFSGNRADYAIVPQTNETTTVQSHAAPAGTYTLANIRFLQFSDETVALTNSAPDGVSLSKTSVAKDVLVNTIVATLSAHDADGDTVHYTLTDDAGGTFKLDGDSLILLKPLDHETQPHQLKITVQASDGITTYDGKPGVSLQTLTIDITDVPGTPSPPRPLALTGTAGADVLTGGEANDVLHGFGGKDVLNGMAGNDKLYGGLGDDTLTGGLGQDVFVFDTKLGRTNAANRKANLDKIVDFSVADDTIWLAKSVFKGIAKKGVLGKDAFSIGPHAHDASDRIVYNKKTGALFYDKDGSGAAEAIQIATLHAKLALTNKDFFVV